MRGVLDDEHLGGRETEPRDGRLVNLGMGLGVPHVLVREHELELVTDSGQGEHQFDALTDGVRADHQAEAIAPQPGDHVLLLELGRQRPATSWLV